jgi:DNA-directed RNA polymerase subunit M/transcription elongation factor TFIIS
MENNIRNRASNKIKQYLDLSDFQTSNLEKSIFNWSIDQCTYTGIFPGMNNNVFLNIYNDKFVSVLSNLDPHNYLNNHGRLLKKIIDGTLLPHELASMEPYDMNPDKWMPIINAKLSKERSMLDANIEAKTDLFKCGKCKGRKCSYYEMQIRSADESATIFVTCLNSSCRNKWRIG